jgi:hypothetical protein
MCTLVILRRPGHPWPLLLAANRDEMLGRPWRPPGRHWPDRPYVVAGLDETAGGSWLGLNDQGVVAGVLNRVDSLGPAEDKRSRGELVLEALDHADAFAAAESLADLNPAAYRSFNLVVADNRDAYWLRNRAGEPGAPDCVEIFPLPTGLSMITARERNDTMSPRIRTHLPQFEAAAVPDPEAGNWEPWQRLLASRHHAVDQGPEAAMTIVTDAGFGTVSSSMIGLPEVPRSLSGEPPKPVWLFAPGSPDEADYERVEV